MNSARILPALILAASAFAVLSARPFAGGWNDGSRLATVECLVDYRTLRIDQSIFANPSSEDRPSPYPADNELLRTRGTLDKMYIEGHYYSDKSPLPALGMAAVYQVYRWLGGPAAAERPDRFCLLITLATSGLAYVASIACLYLLAGRIGLSPNWSMVLAAAFGLGTVAAAYVQHVNNHILLTAVAAALFLILASDPREYSRRKIAWLGFLAGLGYAIDLGAGPLLLALVGSLVFFERGGSLRTRVSACLLFLAAASPGVIGHHLLNYAIGGTIGPANADPAHFDWPGSPFYAGNMTGGWNHAWPGAALIYALDMLFGKRGFVGHNLPLLLLLPFVLKLRRLSFAEKPVVVAGLLWSVSCWLLYAATSRNMSGMCCSVRWLVPMLVPGFLTLAVGLRELPAYRIDFLIVAGWALLMGVGMMIRGPWTGRMMPFYWSIYLSCVLTWLAWRRVRRRLIQSAPAPTIHAWRFPMHGVRVAREEKGDFGRGSSQDCSARNE